MMRAVLLLALATTGAFAQTDAPPDTASAPDELPALDEPARRPPGAPAIDVSFQGATAFPEGRLREAIARPLATIDEFGLDEANAYDCAFFLESFYRQNGYTQAAASAAIAGGNRLRIAVVEGPLTGLGPVTVEGNSAFPTEELTTYLLGPTRERFPRVRELTTLPLVESDLAAGADIVRRLYASAGYLDAEVEPPALRFNRDRTSAAVTLVVREGRAYRLGAIRFVGGMVFPEETLRAEVQRDSAEVFTPGRLAAAERRLTDYHRERGYFTAEVSAEADISAGGGDVPVTFAITPGPLYRFDGVTVSGARDVRPDFISRRLARLSGRVYDPKAIDDRFRELIGTGLFRTLNITPEAIGGNLVRLNVTVEEAKAKEFGFGLGYATFDGGIAELSYTDRNLFRSGRPFTASIEATQRGYSGEISYRDPWLFDSDYELRLRLYAANRRLVGYTKQELGFRPELTRRITPHWEVSAFVLAKTVTITDVLIEPRSEVGRERYSVASLGFSQTFDFRNNPTLPTRGWIVTTTFDVAPNGLGDIAFARGTARASYYVPVTEKSTFALGARAGVIGTLSDEGLPIDERFFNGGATTVRSYPELNLGPRDRAGYPLGGEAFTVFNAEYTFPIWGDLQGATFADAGNVVPRAADFGLSGMRYALGAGLRYNLPIGAIRLDYGWNPAPAPGDAQGAFHFAIGVAF